MNCWGLGFLMGSPTIKTIRLYVLEFEDPKMEVR